MSLETESIPGKPLPHGQSSHEADSRDPMPPRYKKTTMGFTVVGVRGVLPVPIPSQPGQSSLPQPPPPNFRYHSQTSAPRPAPKNFFTPATAPQPEPISCMSCFRSSLRWLRGSQAIPKSPEAASPAIPIAPLPIAPPEPSMARRRAVGKEPHMSSTAKPGSISDSDSLESRSISSSYSSRTASTDRTDRSHRSKATDRTDSTIKSSTKSFQSGSSFGTIIRTFRSDIEGSSSVSADGEEEANLDHRALLERRCSQLLDLLVDLLNYLNDESRRDSSKILKTLIKLVLLVQKPNLEKEVVWLFYSKSGVAIVMNVVKEGSRAVQQISAMLLAIMVLLGYQLNENSGSNYFNLEEGVHIQNLMLNVVRRFDARNTMVLTLAEKGMGLIFQCLCVMLELGWELPTFERGKGREFIQTTFHLVRNYNWPTLRGFGFGLLAILCEKKSHNVFKQLVSLGCVSHIAACFKESLDDPETTSSWSVPEIELSAQKFILRTLCANSREARQQLDGILKNDPMSDVLAKGLEVDYIDDVHSF